MPRQQIALNHGGRLARPGSDLQIDILCHGFESSTSGALCTGGRVYRRQGERAGQIQN